MTVFLFAFFKQYYAIILKNKKKICFANLFACNYNPGRIYGAENEIRTRDAYSTPVFGTGTFNHSDISAFVFSKIILHQTSQNSQ